MAKTSSSTQSAVAATPAVVLRERIIRRAAVEFQDGMYGILYKAYIIFNFNTLTTKSFDTA